MRFILNHKEFDLFPSDQIQSNFNNNNHLFNHLTGSLSQLLPSGLILPLHLLVLSPLSARDLTYLHSCCELPFTSIFFLPASIFLWWQQLQWQPLDCGTMVAFGLRWCFCLGFSRWFPSCASMRGRCISIYMELLLCHLCQWHFLMTHFHWTWILRYHEIQIVEKNKNYE